MWCLLSYIVLWGIYVKLVKEIIKIIYTEIAGDV